MTMFENVGVFIRENVSKIALPNRKQGDRVVAAPSTETCCGVWVYHWYWPSVLPVPRLAISVEDRMHCP